MDARATKISATMRRKKLDNFKTWRDQMKKSGLIKSTNEPLEQNGDLAELIGAILGDGNITAFPRCECLRITGDCAKLGFVFHYASLIEKVFFKKPAIAKVTASNAMIVTIYEKNISERLGVPTGSRVNHQYHLPQWIRSNREYTIRFLRGLYEAEGSVSHHPKTYTHKFTFSNANKHLLGLVFELTKELGFNPHVSYRQVQVSRKEEVQKLPGLLQFRCYDT